MFNSYKGALGTQDAYSRASIRTGISTDEIESTLLKLIDSLTLIDESVELLHEIHQKDIHTLFCLSNMPYITIKHLERKYSIWEMFDECLISSRIGMIKPDLQIYKYMIDSYALSPKYTVFIDDTQKNIDSAKKLGINTILFIDPIQCRRELEKFDCL
jgi:FMN phosphatase YigB (HAD superfamily)